MRIRWSREREARKARTLESLKREARFRTGPGLSAFLLSIFNASHDAPTESQGSPLAAWQPQAACPKQIVRPTSKQPWRWPRQCSLTIQRETPPGTGRASESQYAGVPQLVEGCVANAKVAGSSPAACSNSSTTSGVPLHSVQRDHGDGWAGCARPGHVQRENPHRALCARAWTQPKWKETFR